MVIVNILAFWDVANYFKRRQFAELRRAAFGSTLGEPQYTKLKLKRKGASLPDGRHLILRNKVCPNLGSNSSLQRQPL